MRKKKVRVSLTDEDRAYIENLYETHRKTIYYVALRESRNPDLAEDLSQDLCINLMNNISTIRKLDCCKIDAYIVIAIRRLYINYLKKESRMTLLPIEKPSIAAKVCDRTAEIEAEKEDVKLSLEVLLEQLSARDSLLLQSKYILGMTDEELAATFDCSAHSIRALLSRARKRARAIGLKSKKGDENHNG